MLPEILQRKKFFPLLHKIDVDLVEGVQALGCPTVGARCIKEPIYVSPAVALPVCLKRFPYAIVSTSVAVLDQGCHAAITGKLAVGCRTTRICLIAHTLTLDGKFAIDSI